MDFVTGAFATWLVGLTADAGLKRAITWARGTEFERALRQAAGVAVQRAADELSPGNRDRADQIGMVVDQVFGDPVPYVALAGDVTMLEVIQAGIAGQLAVLGDAGVTGTGQSSADVLGVPVTTLEETLARHLLGEIVTRGARGESLTPLASQLNADVTHLESQRIEGILGHLVQAVLEALAKLHDGPSTTFSPVFHGLPADAASFTGRNAEQDRLMSALPISSDPVGVVRIVAVDGMAGVGKTVFAVHAAHQIAHRFPDGQLFVRLHAHTPGQRPANPADVLAVLLQGDGIPRRGIPQGLDERAALWRDRMAGRKVLLMLDDANSSEQVQPLLPASAGTLVLVTSRRRLTALPDALPLTLGTLPPGEAALLFTRLADRPGLVPDDDAVATITALCGYLPLALSLTAGQFKHHPAWTAVSLAADLASAADRLAAMAAENISVTASFELSYRNLGDDRQRLVRRLGLHPGTDMDAYAAAALDGTDLATARKGLDELFGYHLIDEPTAGRYRLHDLIREHARTLSATDSPAVRDAAATRLLDYYLHTAYCAGQQMSRPTLSGAHTVGAQPAHAPDLRTHESAITWLDTERFNLHAAAEFAAHHDRPGYTIGISAAIRSFLRTHGYWDQAMTLHDAAVKAARQSGDQRGEADALIGLGDIQRLAGDLDDAAASFVQALDLHRDFDDGLGQAGALSSLGVVQRVAGDYPAAIASQEQALELFGDHDDLVGEADALNELGVVRYQTGNYPAAAASLSRALERYRELGNRLGEGDALNYLALLHQLTGDYPAATASAADALELHRDIGNENGQANALTRLGVIEYRTGDYRKANANLDRALELHRHLGSRLGEANALYYLGVVRRFTGDYPGAINALTQALNLYRTLGNRNGEANAIIELGAVQRATGDYAAAKASLTLALTLHHDLGNSLGEANALLELGAVQRAAGHYATAMGSLTHALKLQHELSDRIGEAEALSQLGAVQQALGEHAVAADNLTRALRICRDVGNPYGEAEVLNNVGELALASGQHAKAYASHDSALGIATRIGAPLEEAHALEGIGKYYLQEEQPVKAIAALRNALATYRHIGSPRAKSVESNLSGLERPEV